VWTAARLSRRLLVKRAHAQFAANFKRLKLPNLKTTRVKCADCDQRAEVWDHRDYRYPFAVEPVCVGCNSARGPGKPHNGLVPPRLKIDGLPPKLARLKVQLSRHRITLWQLAQAMDVSENYVWMVLNGRRRSAKVLETAERLLAERRGVA
jgi:hypothetical protein